MLDWDDLRFFLAVARTGSLSAAARGLRCTQSTVGRRLGSLEARLGVRLVNRTHHVRPKQQEIVIRRIGSIALGVYASPDYLERFGTPNFADGCVGHRVLALPDQFCDLPQMRWLADLTTKARVVLKTGSYE